MPDELMLINGEYYAGWITLALINAVLAQGKNRRGLAWLVISLFLGPVATLLLAIVRKLDNNKRPLHK